MYAGLPNINNKGANLPDVDVNEGILTSL